MRGDLYSDGEKYKDVQFYSGLSFDENGQIVSRQGMVFGPNDQMPEKIMLGMETVEDVFAKEYELRFRRSQKTAHCYRVKLEAPFSMPYKGQYYVPAIILERLTNRSGAVPRAQIVVKKNAKGPKKLQIHSSKPE